MKKLMIIGAGGHGRVVADCAESMNIYSDIVFADSSYPSNKQNLHWPIVADDKCWQQYINSHEFIVAIGRNDVRLKLSAQIKALGGTLATLIHPSATVSQYANIGKGSVILANSAINVAACIGQACIVNTGATIDHDCQIGDGCHIAPGVNLSGTVTLGEQVWVGVGATIIESRTIGDHAFIGAGSTVISDLSGNATYVGVPAKKVEGKH